MQNIAYVGVGSNLGDKIKHCNDAIEEIAKCKENTVIKRSSLYRTEPWGKEDQDWFINCAIKLETSLDVLVLLELLKNIELKFKSTKKEKWSPRIIDLDILFFNDEIIDKPGILVPHPFIQERRFVLVPLCEICSELIHPVFNKSVKDLLKKTSDDKEVIQLQPKEVE
ncbi:MAG: 2-amino-4-hydroxy-6-hydroxymethyldihydropteridine diphosphokinase [Thermodesulfobacteriota bacterium]|nr:2-amino-4-hydroxy-6-hydroxymethyldihydropteridine diphosphokinase [Thermodesulfobacteriota bacterium]